MSYYIQAISKKSDMGAPMSYGRAKEPMPDALAMRGRATVFESEKEAWDALDDTLREAGPWAMKYRFTLVELEPNPAGCSLLDK